MPVILLLADDLVTGRRNPWRAGAAVGLAMAAQLFTSEELLFQTALVLLVAGVLVVVTRPRAITAAALGRIGRGAAAALGVFVFCCGGALWLQFRGPLHQYGSPFTVGYFETFYVPSNLLWLTTRGSSAFVAAYVPGAPEYLAYLGIPLLVTAPIVGLARIGELRARLLLGVGAVFALCSPGGAGVLAWWAAPDSAACRTIARLIGSQLRVNKPPHIQWPGMGGRVGCAVRWLGHG